MDIDDFGKFCEEFVGKYTHVADEDDEVGFLFIEGGDNFGFGSGNVCEVALGGSALDGVTLFVAENADEFDPGHFVGFEFVDDGLEGGAVGRGEDRDFEH